MLSQELEKRLNATNLGEVIYIYEDSKDDLLDSYWLAFKKNNQDLIKKEKKKLKLFDSLFGFILWGKRDTYKMLWQELFKRIGLKPKENIIIDSSKTTFYTFMRGIYLNYSFSNVYFIKPKRKMIDVFKSM